MTTFYYFFACAAASCAMYIVLVAPWADGELFR
jgi:hypothetical protein